MKVALHNIQPISGIPPLNFDNMPIVIERQGHVREEEIRTNGTIEHLDGEVLIRHEIVVYEQATR